MTRSVYKLAVGGAAIGLAAALLTVPSASAADSTLTTAEDRACTAQRSGQMSGLAKSSTLDGPPVTAGAVHAPGGAAVSGARVRLMAWPRAEELAKAEDGDKIVQRAIGWATTGADGTYELRVDPNVDLDPFTSDNGTIDITLIADSARGYGVYAGHVVRQDLVAVAGSAADPASSDGRTHEALPRNLDLDLEEAPEEPTGHAESSCSAADDGMTTSSEYTYLGKRHARIGYVAAAGSTGVKFSFISGSMSKLGIAIKIGNGAFKAGESVERNSSGTSTWPASGYSYGTGTSRWWYTNYHYGKYYTPGHREIPSRTEVKPTSHAGGFWKVYDNIMTSAIACNWHDGNTAEEQDRGRAYGYEAGVDISDFVGFDVYARTGYNVGTKHGFHFKQRRRLCGLGNPHDGDYVGHLRVRT